MGEPMKPFFDATLLLGDSGALRAQMARDGYLFVRGLLARDVVANVQRQVGVLARDGGWLRADAPVEEARAGLRSAIPWMGAGSPGRSRRATCCFSTA